MLNEFILSLSMGDLVLYQPPKAKAGRFEFEGFNAPSGYEWRICSVKSRKRMYVMYHEKGGI